MSGFPKGGSGSGAVTSVFTRTGAVVATSGDYTASQVTNAADLSNVSLQTFAGPIGTPGPIIGNGGTNASARIITDSTDATGNLYINVGSARVIALTINGTGVAYAYVNKFVFAVGTNTAQAAAVTTPTLGAAAQLANTAVDQMLYIVIGTAGTLTIAIGPSVGVANTIVAGLAVPLGAMYSIRLPAGWFIAVTTGTTATWTTTAIVC